MPRRTLLLGLAPLLPGCLCAEPGAAASIALAPLRPVVLELPEGRRVDVPVGATERRPLVLVLTDRSSGPGPGSCDDWFSRFRAASVFVVCDATKELGDGLRETLRELKKAAPAHLGKPPLTVVLDRERPVEAVDLVSAEPAFFATVVFARPADELLSLVWVSTFVTNGGRRLLVPTNSEEVRARVLAASRPAGVVPTFLEPGPRLRDAAVAFATSPDAGSPRSEAGTAPH